MRGTITTPKFYLKCTHCGKEELIDIEYEVDVPTEFLSQTQDGAFEFEGKIVKEGDTVPCICSDCNTLGAPCPEGWERLELEEEVR